MMVRYGKMSRRLHDTVDEDILHQFVAKYPMIFTGFNRFDKFAFPISQLN